MVITILKSNANLVQFCNQSSRDFKLAIAIQTGTSIRIRFGGIWIH